FLRARVDGVLVRLTDDLKLDRKIKHDIEIAVDRLTIPSGDAAKAAFRPRLADAVEQALGLGEGNLVLSTEAAAESSRAEKRRQAEDADSPESPATSDVVLSAHYACTHCNLSYEPPSPQMFSFNSPHGMCLECDGLGTRYTFDVDLLIPDPSK